MSRGMGKVQRAILYNLRISKEPQEVGWIADGVYDEIHGCYPPDPIPHTFLVSVRRAVRSLEQTGHVMTGLACRDFAPRNFAYVRLKLDLTKWVWLPGMEPPRGWCCPLSVSSPIRNQGEETLTSPAGKTETTVEEIDLNLMDVIDGFYKIKGDELVGLDAMTVAKKIADFLELDEGDHSRDRLFVLLMRRNS